MKDANNHLFSVSKKGFLSIFSAVAITSSAIAGSNLVKAAELDNQKIVISEDLEWMKSQVSMSGDTINIDFSKRFNTYIKEGSIQLESITTSNIVSVSVHGVTINIDVKGFGSSIIKVTAKDQNGKTITDQFHLTISQKGDINGDGIVNPADVLQIYQVTSGKLTLSPEQLKLLDVNGDGKVTNADASALMTNYVGKKPTTATNQDYFIQMREVNDVPLVKEDTYSIDEDNTLDVDAETSILANDMDIDGDQLKTTKVSSPTHGLLTLNPDGTFTYVPEKNFNGTDQFTYKVNDGKADSEEQTVKINVQAVNDQPLANATSLNVTEDGDAESTLTASDVDGDRLTFSLVEDGQKGNVTLNPTTGAYTYQPKANEHGKDSFKFKVNDGKVDSEIVTVEVTIAAVNDAPIANGDSYSTDEDQQLAVSANAGILSNDVDVDGDDLKAVKVTAPAHGSLTLNPDGSFTYLPDTNFNGTDQFTYKINDGKDNSAVQTVNIQVNAVNDQPVAKHASLDVTEDEAANGTLKASDIEEDALTFSLVGDGKKGNVAINPTTGAYTYQPKANENGNDSFKFKVNDGTVDSEIITVEVTIAAVNDGPITNVDSYSTDEDQQLVISANAGILANDVDVDGDELKAIKVSSPAHGSLTLNPDGSFTYVPDANFNGSDQFTYKINDGKVNSAVQTVYIQVNAVNDQPVAKTTSLDVIEDVTANGTLSASDYDEDALIFSLVEDGQKGNVTMNSATGAYTYQPKANENGKDSFKFKVNDGTVDSEIITVEVTIAAVNDAPIANADSYSTDEDQQLVIAANAGILTNDVDIEGDELSAVLVSGPAHGSITLNPDGSFTYASTENFQGADQFTYKVNDGKVNSAVQTVNIQVNAVNDQPVANPASLDVTEDVDANGTLSATDVDQDALTFSLVEDGKMGNVLINPNTGAYTYHPKANENGKDSFKFKVNDGKVDSEIITVEVTIASVNDAPEISDVKVVGELVPGETVEGQYHYSDIENDLEGASTYQWYLGTKADGSDKLAIQDATGKTYVIQDTDEGYYLFFEVTPVTSGVQSNQVFVSKADKKVASLLPEMTGKPLDSETLTELEMKNNTGSVVVVNLKNDKFQPMITAEDFILNNAPLGTSVIGAYAENEETAYLFLDYDGTDFDIDIPDFTVTAKPSATVKGLGVTSSPMGIKASVDAPTPFISEFLQGSEPSRSGLEVYAPFEMAAGLTVELHQWDTVNNKKIISTANIIPNPNNPLQILIGNTFYDFFDITNNWYYNNDELPLGYPGRVTNALILKQNGKVIDTVGDPHFNGPKPVLPNGGTMLRKPGTKDGLATYNSQQWIARPVNDFTDFGRWNN